jgi:hypothetical protein
MLNPTEARVMNPRRFATVAVLCLAVVLAGSAVAWVVGFGRVGTEDAGGAPITQFKADAERAPSSQITATGSIAAGNVDMAQAAKLVTAADTAVPPATQPLQVANASASDPLPGNAEAAVNSLEVFGECLIAETCVDR